MPHQGPRVPGDYPRAARWDTATVLRQLAEATGVALTDAGRCRGGQIGAAYVRWPDGHTSVLTGGPSGAAAARQGGALTVLARSAGVPRRGTS